MTETTDLYLDNEDDEPELEPGTGPDQGQESEPDQDQEPEQEEEPPKPEYSRVEDWVTDYFTPMFRRTLGGEFRWCAQWWEHGEAISRLTALWHAWEALRLQPGTGMSAWYSAHLDHHLPVLLGARGPFYQCSEDRHRDPHQARCVPAPHGWWAPMNDNAQEETEDTDDKE
jgi:hypothetical protein